MSKRRTRRKSSKWWPVTKELIQITKLVILTVHLFLN